MNKFTKWIETLRALILYPYILKQVKNVESNMFFFFPRFQTGGAEKVHLEIIKSVSDKKPVCFFTNLSDNDDLLAAYTRHATVINLHRWGWKTSFRKKMARIIATSINKVQSPVIFGSNSELFYDLFPHLNDECVKIDLLHTDLSHLPLSIENYASALTSMLNHRILLGTSHKEKIKVFYKNSGIPAEEIDKIKIIHNGVPVPPMTPERKNYLQNKTVLFVARNGYEKRPELFLQIANQSHIQKLPFNFQMIGDFENFASIKPDNVQIIGKITDKALLDRYYKKAHFIFITSIFEGLPMVLLEGMCHGVIPVSTDVGEISQEINQKNMTGFIIDNLQTENEIVLDFIKKMEEIANGEYDLNQYADNGYNLVKNKFSGATFTKNYRNILIN
ncbi:MAG: glycosyltransferase family 4 protein [Sphingobacterium sp.]